MQNLKSAGVLVQNSWWRAVLTGIDRGWIKSDPRDLDPTARIERKRAETDGRAAGGGGNAGERRRAQELRRAPLNLS
jgi:hypothetical protein